jgi:hypothetical protein
MMRLPVTNLPVPAPPAPPATPAVAPAVVRTVVARPDIAPPDNRPAKRRAPAGHRVAGPPVQRRGGLRRAPKSFYESVLGLHRIRPNGIQRILLIEGSAVVGVVIALADVASAWVIPVLPAAVAGVVKFEDVVATVLSRAPTPGVQR